LNHLWEQVPPEALVAQVYEHTRGNPFYVNEIAKSLIDDGLISFREHREIDLSYELRDLFWRRIRHLDFNTQTCLRKAASLGETFCLNDLRQISGLSEWQTLEHLDAALDQQLVQEVHGDFAMRFRHPEIHQLFYEDFGLFQHRILHRQVGNALERRASTQPGKSADFD
jgi:predicted ATPase